MAENQAAMPDLNPFLHRTNLVKFVCCVIQFNPVACVVRSPGYTAGQNLVTLPNGRVCQIYILDKVSATERYFEPP
jgi:hypothetical protein